MLHTKTISIQFCVEALNTSCHIHNKVSLQLGINVTNYQLWKGKKPNVKYFHVFGSPCFILAYREPRRRCFQGIHIKWQTL